MNLIEAEQIAYVVGHADGACTGCVRSLVARLNESCMGFEFRVPAESFVDCDDECYRINVTVREVEYGLT